MSRTFGRDDKGLASSMVAFLVAGVLFVASIAAVLVTTRQGGTGAAASTVPQADLAVQAQSLAQVLVMSPGYTAAHGDWATGADEVDGTTTEADNTRRLGLRQAGSDDDLLMSFEKFQNLRRAPLRDTVVGGDGYVNYHEARAGFGLDEAGLDFHIRAYPTLPKVAELLKTGYKDPNLRIAYIGNIVEHKEGGGGTPAPEVGAGLVVGPVTCSHDAASPKAYRITSTVKNGGTAPTQFEAIFDIEMSNGESEYHKKNTFLVAADATTDIFADVAATAGRTCAGATVDLRIYDSTNLLAEVDATLAQPGTTPAVAPRALVIESTSESYLPTESVSVSYGGKNLVEDNKLILTVCPGTTECRLGADTSGQIVQITVPKKEKDRVVPLGTFAAGEYTIRLYDNTATPDAAIEADSMRARNRLLVVTPNPGPYVPVSAEPEPETVTYEASAGAATEIAYLEQLVERFCPTWFDSKTGSAMATWGTGSLNWDDRCQPFKVGEPDDATDDQPHFGDVYPQLKKTLKAHLSTRLMSGSECSGTARYDWTSILIVGSDVDHNVLTSGDVKHCIEAWVMGGGTLIVFGSAEMNTHWLESVFHTALESSSGGLSVPDAGHPVLHVGDDLDYLDYEHERAWRLKTTGSFDAEGAFTRVANDADTGDAILAVGDPGAFGNGNVILSGWTAYDLKGSGPGADGIEGLKFVNNLLMLGYRDLFLDYGPSLPPNANVQPAVSRVHIQHPQFEAPILLNLAVYVFPGVKS